MRLRKKKSSSNDLDKLMNSIQYNFRNLALLELALCHRSFGKQNNERLEFLGDSLLNFIIASELYKQFPTAKEGQLSRLRSYLVCEAALAEVAQKFELGPALRLGTGEKKSGGAERPSILADAVEALIGAIYLDGGLKECYTRVTGWYKEHLACLSLNNEVYKDSKSRLQELLQSQKYPLPKYRLIGMKGEEHHQVFIIECRNALLDHPIMAEGTSRRKAEQKAAELVLKELTGVRKGRKQQEFYG